MVRVFVFVVAFMTSFVEGMLHAGMFEGLEEIKNSQFIHQYRRQTRRSADRTRFEPPSSIRTWVKGDNHDLLMNFKFVRRMRTGYIQLDNGRRRQKYNSDCVHLYEDAERLSHALVDTCSNPYNITVLVAEIGHREGPFYALPADPGDPTTLRLYKSPSACGLTADNTRDSVGAVVTGSETATGSQAAETTFREKRATGSYTVELVLVIDQSLYKFWYELTPSNMSAVDREIKALSTMETFFIFHVNGVNMRYQSLASYGINIAVKLVAIYVLQTKSEASFVNVDTSTPRGTVAVETLLPDFQTWIASRRSINASFPVGDHYMFLTSHDLTQSNNTAAAGYAQSDSLCTMKSSSLVEERFNFLSVTIETHELGHALGGRHDGDNNLCSSDDGYILATSNSVKSGAAARNPWKFSECSAKDLGAFLAAQGKALNCLQTDDNDLLLNTTGRKLPGQTYLPDDQCRYAVGEGSVFSRAAHIGDFAAICTGMSCTTTSVQLLRNILPADGTSCGDQKWCINGTCVKSAEAPTKDETCLFWDQPGEYVPGVTCQDRVSAYLGNCYHEEIRAPCCTTCSHLKLNIPGCEYGDRSNCSAIHRWQCYNETIRTQSCCKTCADFRNNITGCEYGDSFTACTAAFCGTYPQECCNTCLSSNTSVNAAPTQAPSTTQKGDDGNKLPEWVVPVASGGGGALVLALIVTVVCCRCLRHKPKGPRRHTSGRSGGSHDKRPPGHARSGQYPHGGYRSGGPPGTRPNDFRHYGRHRY